MSEPSASAKTVVVIGGGISGLITAFKLQQRGIDVRLLERSDHVGGVMRTIVENGFLTEWGPNSFRSNDDLDDLIKEIGLDDERVEADPAAPRFIYHKGQLKPFPMGIGGFLSTSLLSFGGKLRILAEPFIRKRRETGEESVGGFVARRLGRQVEQTFVSPFISGIYAGDSSKLSINATFPTLVEFEELGGSILIGAIKSMRRRKQQTPQKKRPRRRPTLVSFKKGIESFPNSIAEQLPNIFTNCTDIQIKQNPDNQTQRYSVSYKTAESNQSIVCDAVIVATPAFAAADIVRPLSNKAAEALSAIPYPPVIVVGAAFRKDQITRSVEGFGFLIPRTEGLRMLGCVWSSSLFPGRAPDDHHLITIFLGGATDPGIADLSDDEIKAIVSAELKKTLSTDSQPQIVQVFRHRRAIPQYTIGHIDRVRIIEEAISGVPGLFFVGNYLEGVAAGDCAKVSTKTAEKIWQYLGLE